MREYELIIIGGGAAGMLAAIEGKKNGINRILVIEKDPILGGTLNSAGYPINKDKTVIGKEYKETLLDEFEKYDIEVQLNTMALKIEEKDVLCTSEINGIEKLRIKDNCFFYFCGGNINKLYFSLHFFICRTDS